jgi:DHA2 family multidrug resistance protein
MQPSSDASKPAGGDDYLRANRWAVLGIIMLGTFMAILDSSIVNVALPHMMSTFGVDRDKIEWVSTGFMLTSAVVMPLVGWLTNRISYKALYLGSLAIFTVASLLCALAWSYESLIAARVLQALGGGAIQPIGMAIVAELFDPHERGRALGIWGTGIMAGPALGPTLGGYLTDAFSWRTIFSVNLPFGVLALIAGMIIMRPLRARGARRPFDLAGFCFLAMALVAGLTALSNGQEKGWQSDYIHVCEGIAVVGAVMFITVELAVEHPILDLRLFLIRNYTLSILLAVFRAVGLFGSVFLFPIFLQNLMGYTPVHAGLWMLPNALAVGVTMPVAGRLADRYSPALLTALGCVMVGGSLVLFGNLDPMSDWTMLVLPQFVRGAGLALMMAPLMAAALNAVPRHELPMASSFLNVSQNVGGSLGIALLNNFVTNSIHTHAVRLGEGFPMESQAMDIRLGLRAMLLVFRHEPGLMAMPQARVAFAAASGIARKAQVLGFENGFVFAGLILLAGIPLCLLLTPAAHHLRPEEQAEETLDAKLLAE